MVIRDKDGKIFNVFDFNGLLDFIEEQLGWEVVEEIKSHVQELEDKVDDLEEQITDLQVEIDVLNDEKKELQEELKDGK